MKLFELLNKYGAKEVKGQKNNNKRATCRWLHESVPEM